MVSLKATSSTDMSARWLPSEWTLLDKYECPCGMVATIRVLCVCLGGGGGVQTGIRKNMFFSVMHENLANPAKFTVINNDQNIVLKTVNPLL